MSNQRAVPAVKGEYLTSAPGRVGGEKVIVVSMRVTPEHPFVPTHYILDRDNAQRMKDELDRALRESF